MELKFDSNGLIPAITQDKDTLDVLMLGYMNKEAYEKTVETGKVHYYSRSRQKLWLKGETSGHFQNVCDIRFDCDNDALLITVEQTGGACHTGHKSCFYRTVSGETEISDKVFSPEDVYKSSGILSVLYDIIIDRRANPVKDSYTNYLFDKGIDKILKKVGEETAEVIIASKNDDKSEIVYEVSDLLYHLSVLLAERGVTWEDIYSELNRRHIPR